MDPNVETRGTNIINLQWIYNKRKIYINCIFLLKWRLKKKKKNICLEGEKMSLFSRWIYTIWKGTKYFVKNKK